MFNLTKYGTAYNRHVQRTNERTNDSSFIIITQEIKLLNICFHFLIARLLLIFLAKQGIPIEGIAS